jgi:hypothetical protein
VRSDQDRVNKGTIMFLGKSRPGTSCQGKGTPPASLRATPCLKNGQPPASWHGKPCRTFGRHKRFPQATSCFLGNILPQIRVSQGEKPMSLCLLVWNILLQKWATSCLVGWNVLPHRRGNLLPSPPSHTLLPPHLPLDSAHLPLACPPWTGRMEQRPFSQERPMMKERRPYEYTHDKHKRSPCSII